jgi:hypothetical protein
MQHPVAVEEIHPFKDHFHVGLDMLRAEVDTLLIIDHL